LIFRLRTHPLPRGGTDRLQPKTEIAHNRKAAKSETLPEMTASLRSPPTSILITFPDLIGSKNYYAALVRGTFL